MKLSGELKILTGSALFGLIPVGVMLGKSMGALPLIAGRLLVAALLLYGFQKNRKKYFRIPSGKIPILILWSLLMLVAMVCYFNSIKLSGMAVSSALLGSQPLMIAMLAVLLLKEKLSYQGGISAFLSLTGVALISFSGSTGWNGNVAGIFLAITSALALSFNFMVQKKYLQEFEGKMLVFYQCVFQLPFLIPFAVRFSGSFSWNGLVAILILAVFCTVFAYTLIYNGVRQVHAHKIGVLQGIEYVIPVFIGLLFYHETVQPGALFGIFLIIVSLVVLEFRGYHRKSEKQTKEVRLF